MRQFTRMGMLAAFLLLVLLPVGCGDKGDTNINVTAAVAASDGLDLQALGALAQKAKDSESLEQDINKPGGINNLDLDQNGDVDYIKVSSYGEGNYRGFSFAVDLEGGETQHVAEIEIEKSSGDQATMQVSGNEQIYGSGSHYSSGLSLGDAIFLSWMFGPRYSPYMSPYHYGYYPGYYSPYRPVPMSTYRTTTRTVTNRSSASFTKSNGSQIKSSSKAKSPYKGKSASKGVRASLKSPTKSQKSFAKTDRSKKAGTGGFGKKATTPATGQKKAVQQKTKPKTKPKAKTKPRRRTPTRRRK